MNANNSTGGGQTAATKRDEVDPFEYWLLHRDEPGYRERPEFARLQVFGIRLKRRIARVLAEKEKSEN